MTSPTSASATSTSTTVSSTSSDTTVHAQPTAELGSESSDTHLHPYVNSLPGGKDSEALRAQPDAVRDRDWPTAAFTPEDVFLKELAIQEAQDVEAANLRAESSKSR